METSVERLIALEERSIYRTENRIGPLSHTHRHQITRDEKRREHADATVLEHVEIRNHKSLYVAIVSGLYVPKNRHSNEHESIGCQGAIGASFSSFHFAIPSYRTVVCADVGVRQQLHS